MNKPYYSIKGKPLQKEREMDNKNLYNMIFYGNYAIKYHLLVNVLYNVVKKCYSAEMDACFSEYEELEKTKTSEAGSVLADRLMEIFVKAGVPEESAIFMAMHTVKERLGITYVPHKTIIF